MIDLETRRFFAAASLALRYPERDWLKSFESIENDLEEFSPATRDVLWELMGHFAKCSLMELQMEYVRTFDRKQRACLYLSYYLNGDTRRRGMALLEFKSTFTNEGWSSNGDELDDYLPMLLEFVAMTSSPAGFDLLIEHKAGISLLAIALRDMKSPYAGIVKELAERIPGDESKRALKLIESGPPIEMVGLSSPLAAYGSSESANLVEVTKC